VRQSPPAGLPLPVAVRGRAPRAELWCAPGAVRASLSATPDRLALAGPPAPRPGDR